MSHLPKRLLITIFSQEIEKHSKELLKKVPEYNFLKIIKVKLKKKVKEASESKGESVPLRAAVILCEGTPGSHAI